MSAPDRRLARVVAMAVVVLVAVTANAADYTWVTTGSGASGNWTNGSNWGQPPTTYPVSGDGANLTNSIASGVYTCIFDYAPGFGGPLATLALTSGGGAGQAKLVITNATLDVTNLNVGKNGVLQLDAGGTLNSYNLFDFEAASATARVTSLGGTGLGGTWDLQNMGLSVGSYVDSAALTFDGGVTVTNAGVVNIGNGGINSRAYNSLSLSNGTKFYGSSVMVGYAAKNGGSPNGNNNHFNVGGSGAASYASIGALTVGSGQANYGHGDSNQATVTNATLDVTGALTIGDGRANNNNVTVLNGGTINVLGGNSIYVGAGTTGANGNSLVITNGTVSAGGLTLGGSASSVLVADGGQLVTGVGTITVASGNAIQLDGGAAIQGNITLNGTGISSGGALRNISGNNTYGGLITLAAATRINSDAGLLTLDVASGNAITGTQNLTFGGAGNITVADPINISSGTLTKDGAGTLTLSGTNTYFGTTTVSGGKLALGVTGALDADNNVVLAGGTLSAGNFTNTLGTLNHTASSTIALGSGQLAFADSSALAGTWSGNLILTNTLGATTLRFGTDDSGLTEAQLASITYLGKPVIINGLGYVVPPPPVGTVIIVR